MKSLCDMQSLRLRNITSPFTKGDSKEVTDHVSYFTRERSEQLAHFAKGAASHRRAGDFSIDTNPLFR